MQMQDLQGSTFTCDDYTSSVRSRFSDGPFDDPVLELKKLKQVGTITAYYQKFTSLFHRMQLVSGLKPERQVHSLFVSGLQPELKGPIRMIQPRMLYDAFYLAKLGSHIAGLVGSSSSISVETSSTIVATQAFVPHRICTNTGKV